MSSPKASVVSEPQAAAAKLRAAPAVVVDEYVALSVLRRERLAAWPDLPPCTTWMSHVRLLRAVLHSPVEGRLTRAAADLRIDEAMRPPQHRLRILDPRDYTDTVVSLLGRPRISIYGAELLGAAIHFEAELHVSSANTNDRWLDCLAGTAVRLYAYDDDVLGLQPRLSRSQTRTRDLPGSR